MSIAAVLLPVSLLRLVDGDEGYLLMAARLVSEGRIPYRDFFLPQGPVLPAVFAFAFWLGGRSWMLARVLAGTFAVVTGWLVYRETRAGTGRNGAALFAVAVFVFSGGALGWLTIVKGFGLSTLFLVTATHLIRYAWVDVSPGQGRRADVTAVAAGVAVGLATSTRTYTAFVMPAILALLAWRLRGQPAFWRRVLCCVGGFCVGTLPLWVTAVLGRSAFLFDTLLFHGVREYGQNSLWGSTATKLPLVLKTIGLAADASFGERQLMALMILAVAALLIRALGIRASSAAVVVWPALTLAGALPNPFQPQYFAAVVPFLAIEAGVLLGALLERRRSWADRRWRAVVRSAALVYLGYHVAVGWTEVRRFVRTGDGVPGVWEPARVPRWRIATVEAVAAAIDTVDVPVAASWWPGYLVSSTTAITRSLANDFGFRAAQVLSREERARYHVAGHDDVAAMIERRRPRLFVEGNWANPTYVALLARNGYQVVASVENVRLWLAP